jgi:dolichyl-phosphate-mannose-protein mannosyltransferase
VRERLRAVGGLLALGWLLQYLPYWVMGRVTYLHHYLPAVLFLAPLMGLVLDTAEALLPAGRRRPHLAWGWTVVVTAVFAQFAPAAYGMTGAHTHYARLQWRDLWHLVDPVEG